MLKVNKIQFNYDHESDVLYGNIGKPKSGIADEKGNGIAIKYDVVSGEPIGFIVIDYMKRINRNMIKSIPEFEDVQLPQY